MLKEIINFSYTYFREDTERKRFKSQMMRDWNMAMSRVEVNAIYRTAQKWYIKILQHNKVTMAESIKGHRKYSCNAQRCMEFLKT